MVPPHNTTHKRVLIEIVFDFRHHMFSTARRLPVSSTQTARRCLPVYLKFIRIERIECPNHTALPWAFSKTHSKCEADKMKGSGGMWAKDRWTHRQKSPRLGRGWICCQFEQFLSLSIYCLYRGPAAIRLPQHRHGSPAEGGGADEDGHHAVRCQRHPRPRDLLVQRLPARGPQHQPRPHQTASIRWDGWRLSVRPFNLPISK